MRELMNKSSELSIPSLISEFHSSAFLSQFDVMAKLHSPFFKPHYACLLGVLHGNQLECQHEYH